MDMLLNGEHVILDVDHWFLLLGLIESSPEKETFWSEHREVARSHTEQLRSKVHTAEEMLARLETCNFFRMTQDSENTFTLILGSEIPKKFIRIFLEEFFSAMGVKAKIKENLAKLRVTVGKKEFGFNIISMFCHICSCKLSMDIVGLHS